MNQIYFVLQGAFGLTAKKQAEGLAMPQSPGLRKTTSYFTALLVVMLFSCVGAYAQTTYYSKATATDFNDVNSWGTATDGTGTAPVAISNADNFIVANSAALTLSGNATVRQLTINAGSVTVAANSLTVSKAGTFDSSFVVNTGGTLNLSGTGLVTVNGNVFFPTGSSFIQSGGTLSVDGNNGGLISGSVASGTPIFAVGSSATSYTTGTMSWTGGKIIIVDPHAATTNTHAMYIGLGSVSSVNVNINATTSHTVQIGDGVSTDAGGNTNGFYNDFWVTTGALKTGDYTINTLGGTNRHVTQNYRVQVGGNLTVTSGEIRLTTTSGTSQVAGNIFVAAAGTLTTPSSAVVLSNGEYTSGTTLTSVASTVAQTVGGPGIFRNLVTAPTANFTSLTINNSSSGGVTFGGTSNIAAQPANSMSVSGTLTFTAGKAFTAPGVPFILGISATSTGTLSFTSGGFGTGTTFGRWVGATTVLATIAAGTNSASVDGRFPFVNSTGDSRTALLRRTGAAAAGGILAVTYVNTAGTSVVSLSEDTYTADIEGNDTWAVSSLSGNPITNTTTFDLQLQAPGIFGGTLANASARIAQGNAFVGTHLAGTVLPAGSRTGITPAQLTAAPFKLVAVAAEAPVTSIASGNYSDGSTWSTGVVPTCAQNVAIMAGHTVTVNSTFAEAKNITINTLGVLTIASGDLTVECSVNTGTITNNGTLNVTGGTLNLNGSMVHAAGSTFNQSGGDIVVDGNSGTVATSATAVLIAINTNLVNWTGGTLTIVDPHAATAATTVLTYTNAANVNASAAHTLRFGDGSSTDAGGNATAGFRISTFPSSGRLSLGNVELNTLGGTNRHVTTLSAFGINGNFTINAGSEFRDNATTVHVTGNLVNDGTYIATGTLAFQGFMNGTAAPVATAQAVTGSGTFANSLTAITGDVVSLLVNNSSTQGVTVNMPLDITGVLTLTAGKLNTTGNTITLISTAGTALVGGNATSYVNGPLVRSIANANSATSYIHFPVGKAAYAPIWVAPATTAATQIQAEAFDTNGGSLSSSIIDLAANRRWEAVIVSGAATTVNVRLGDANLVTGNIPVMAPSATGQYTSSFGSTAAFTAGTPPTIQGATAVTGANYTGFISYAKSGGCSGVPAPGNTLASANNICAGTSVTLSVQNETVGAGVTYQWESSANNTAWADVDGATNATLTLVPTAPLYYRLKVTCATGPDTATSASVQILFANSITATTPATRCGTGTVTLSATGSTGTTVRWYAAATGGTALATGETYSPTVSATTPFYAEASIGSPVLAGGKIAPETGWTGTSLDNWGIVFTAVQSTSLNSVDVYSTAAGTLNVKITDAAGVELYATGNIAVANGGTTTPTTIPLNFALTGGSTYKVLVKAFSGVSLIRGGTNLAFPYTNADISVTASEWGGTTTGTYYYFYNFKTGSSCASARVPVTATVNTAPALTLSSNTVAICSGTSSAVITATAGSTDYDTFVWTPSTGVTGNATTGWTFNPSVSTTYTLNASQSTGALCAASATVAVTVNETPSALTVTNITADVCANAITALTATGGNAAGTVTLGTATTLTADTEIPTAFNNRFSGYGMQTIYTAAELKALGMTAGNISAIAFNVATLGSAATNANYTVKIATTALNSLTSTTFLAPTFTTVYGPATYTHTATGWNTIAFTSPYNWDGESNIIVQISMSGANSSNNTQTYYTETVDNTVISANNSNLTTGVLSKKRLNVRFSANIAGNVTWTPSANLYTDAAATTAYVDGASARTVYAKIAASGSASFTATATNPEGGCTVTAAAETFNVIDCSIGWGNLQWPATGDITTCGTHTVYGRVWKAGVTEPDGAGVGMKAWVGVSTTNTDPATWTETQWNVAPFNTGVNESDLGDNDEYKGDITGLAAGTYYYAFRYQYQTGPFLYGAYSGTGGGPWGGTNVNGVLTVNAVALPTATDQAVCQGTTFAGLTVTGTSPKWYTVSTNGTAITSTDVVTAGTYYVSQTISGCESARVTVVVTISSFDAPVATVTQPTCTVATGTITVTSLGTGYTYSINGTDFQSELEFTGVAANTYTLTAKNSLGCTKTASVVVNEQPSVPATPTVTITQPTCSVATGSIEVTAPTGTGMTYSIDGVTYQATATFTGLAASTYSVTAKSAGGCISTAFSAVVNAQPSTPVVTDPADVSVCDSYTLPTLTTGNYFTAANGGGTALSAGANITSSQTIFVYAVSGSCSDEESFVVTVTQSPVLGTVSNVTACDTYTLPTRTVGKYYTQTGGLGTELLAGAVISTNQTIYVYAESATTPNCTSEQSFTVTLTTTPGGPTGAATQVVTVANAADATIEDLQATATGTISWYASEANALSGTDALAAGTQLVSGQTYYASTIVGTCRSTTALPVTVNVVLGRDDFSFTNLKYYPNPVTDKLTISHSSAITSVEVYNLLGQLVVSDRPGTSTAEVNMGQLQQATYIVRISADGKSKDFKVVKK